MTTKELRARDKARWDRIYREKFEDPDYYKRTRILTPQSCLRDVSFPVLGSVEPSSLRGKRNAMRELEHEQALLGMALKGNKREQNEGGG